VKKQFTIILVTIGAVLILVWILLAPRSLPVPQIGVGFPDPRLTRIALTNQSDRPVRVWSAKYDLKYKEGLGSGEMGSGLGVNAVLGPGRSVVCATGVPSLSSRRSSAVTDLSVVAQCKVQLETSWATRFESFRNWWDRYTQAHPWTWPFPYPFRRGPDNTFTVDWSCP
jgi:hypothetical protein